jgi:hypothetical protein
MQTKWLFMSLVAMISLAFLAGCALEDDETSGGTTGGGGTNYTITFNSQGGSSVSAITRQNGSWVTLPTPTRSQHTFNGWFSAASGGIKFGDGGSSYTITQNITMHAQWTQTVTFPVITIQNNTGMHVDHYQIKPSASTDWGNWHGAWLDDGASTTHIFSYMLPANNAYDIRLHSGNSVFIRYRINLSNGTAIRFIISDFTDESNLPEITILNRTGNTLNNLRIRPFSFNDWGRDFGSIGNNGFLTVTIPIPSSTHTVFDIQMSQTSPATTYTFSSVTVTNGMVLMVTRADADVQPLGGMPVIVIENNTGMHVDHYQIKPSASTDWGNWHGAWLDDGASTAHTFPQPLSANNRFDIRLYSGQQEFTRTNITVTDGMRISFRMSDLD